MKDASGNTITQSFGYTLDIPSSELDKNLNNYLSGTHRDCMKEKVIPTINACPIGIWWC